MKKISKKVGAIALTLLFGAVPSLAQRFAVLSDVHVTPGNACDSALRAAVSEINNGKYDAVIVDGDLTNEGSDEQIINVKSILDGIKHPLYVLPGNHENNWSQSATKTFVDTFGPDRFVFEVDSLIVIGINCGPYMKMGDGHIKQEDLHWLKSTLDKYNAKDKRVLSFNHYPIRKDDLDNYMEYAAVLAQYPVLGHINGHYHTFMTYNTEGIDCAMVRALDMRNGDYGYSIVEVSPEWTHVYNKQLGHSPRAKFAWANNTAHHPVKIKTVADIVNPDGYEINRVWVDSASIFTRLGFDKNNVYFATSLGDVKAVNKSTGKQAWTTKSPDGASIFSRPVALGKGSIAAPYASGIMLLDAKNGHIKRVLKSKEGPYVADGLLTDDGRAYIQGGYKRIERRRPSDGKLIWNYDSLFNYCQAAPSINGDDVIFGAWDTNLRCISLKDGRLKWVWNNGKTANMLGPGNVVPVVTNDKVIVVAPDRYMTAIDRTTGKQLWRDNSHRYRESLGHSSDLSRVYAKTMDGELVAVDTHAPDFKELWTVDMGLGYEHAPCIVAEQNGVVYAGSRRGIVTAVDPVAQKVIWSIPLGVSEINGIDIDPTTGDIYVSLIEGSIFRITKK
ncbi:MAG: PQQ-binding-like beta-propeller repeat protein [Muribaculaceae bacterium]|nr:PQQ-binding-like beta-propeller repeat protein [Muribaculaceae bacterium]